LKEDPDLLIMQLRHGKFKITEVMLLQKPEPTSANMRLLRYQAMQRLEEVS